jgi:hypothetical protein
MNLFEIGQKLIKSEIDEVNEEFTDFSGNGLKNYDEIEEWVMSVDNSNEFTVGFIKGVEHAVKELDLKEYDKKYLKLEKEIIELKEIKDTLWEFISESDIPEITKRLEGE